ncbi:MAG: mechanosensitive ion channel family protein [Verrucomicrobiota bacterium JB023]|nr:mechanosensitive ion channel family protein [Verrucomicrobiota bacterium JB023]
MSAKDVMLSLDRIWQILEESVRETLKGLIEQAPNFAAGLVILGLVALVSWLYKLVIGRVLDRTKWRTSLKELVKTFGKTLIWIIGVLIAAMVIFPGLTPAKALGAAGLASVAVGLAFKDIFQNFFAGVLLLWKFPFEPGDFIECEGVRGRVVETRLRVTTVRKPSGELVVVPNNHLISNPLDVIDSQRLRRTLVKTGVAYKEDLARAKKVVEEAVSACQSVSSEKPLDVFVSGFGASSMDMDVFYWTDSRPYEMRRSNSEVALAIKEALDREGIEIPFPYRTLTFDEPLPIRQLEQEAR